MTATASAGRPPRRNPWTEPMTTTAPIPAALSTLG